MFFFSENLIVEEAINVEKSIKKNIELRTERNLEFFVSARH